METQEPIYIANATSGNMARAHTSQENSEKPKQTPVNHGEAQTCPQKPTRPRNTNQTLGI